MWPPRTLAITDRTRLGVSGEAAAARVVEFARAVAEAGVDAVQVRERDWDDARLLHVTREICDAVRHTSCRVLVNERAHVAWAAGAHGVHLRSDGMPPHRLRAVQPTGQLIGRSVHLSDPASAAGDADYALFGTVFASASKAPTAPVAGPAALAAWVGRARPVPVLAVGGIDVARCEAVREAGAVGIGAIDLFAVAWSRGAGALDDAVGSIHAVFGHGERAE